MIATGTAPLAAPPRAATGRPTRVLFVYRFFNYMEPLGILYLSAALKKAGHETHFYDVGIEPEADLAAFFDRVKPDVVAYSTTTGMHRYYAALNRRLKASGRSFVALFGGPHPTYEPTFIEDEGVDVACQGEGEGPIVDLADAIRDGARIAGIANLSVKAADGAVTRACVRPFIADLDEIPFPDRELIYKYNHYRKLSTKYVLASRGCPYDCTYCFNHALEAIYEGKGKFIRRRSVANLIAELKDVVRTPNTKRVFFIDDVFLIEKKWSLAFCDAYAKEIGVPFMACTRIELVTEEIARALKKANINTLVFAVESADPVTRRETLKRDMDDALIVERAEILRRNGIPFYTQNMLGLPGESLDDCLKTLKFNAKLRPGYAWASIFQPYPGTELGKRVSAEGLLETPGADVPEHYYHDTLLKIDDRREIRNLQKWFSIAVAYPFLIPVIERIIRLPGNGMFAWLWQLFRGYAYLFKIRWMSLSDVLLRN